MYLFWLFLHLANCLAHPCPAPPGHSSTLYFSIQTAICLCYKHTSNAVSSCLPLCSTYGYVLCTVERSRRLKYIPFKHAQMRFADAHSNWENHFHTHQPNQTLTSRRLGSTLKAVMFKVPLINVLVCCELSLHSAELFPSPLPWRHGSELPLSGRDSPPDWASRAAGSLRILGWFLGWVWFPVLCWALLSIRTGCN